MDQCPDDIFLANLCLCYLFLLISFLLLLSALISSSSLCFSRFLLNFSFLACLLLCFLSLMQLGCGKCRQPQQKHNRIIKHNVRIIPISNMTPPELKSKFNPKRSLFDLCSHCEKRNELFEKLGQSFSPLKYLK